MEKRSIGIGLMGLGVVGGQVARVLIDKADFPARPRRRMAALLPHIAEEPGATIAEEEEEEEEE